ncbi:hypothetical protein Sjap_024267 [Stephania japonica]|uniref:RRM domain-containing protein n=1 Tax=Stephania japonica TaxID=461633 RepID=A0AAP0ED36_9MAGN
MGMEGGENATTETRIFVGGLGESVGEGDLRKTFSSLGIIKNVEFVRSRGRSFAYLDFQPSSPVSLPKLFSTYNGCVWKGGRLRLEKAKEHYLTRLKREWTEDEMDDRRTSGGVVDKNAGEPEPLKPRISEKTQIHLFFPKLGKVKALPYSGTGKHKYSFRRIEVLSSLPINFCDCEEHSGPSKSVKVKQIVVLEDKSGLVNEEERNMMSSVMNNIFERGLSLRNMHKTARTDADQETTVPSLDGPSLEDSRSDEGTDLDNLVMNLVGSSASSRKLGLLKKHGEDMTSKDQVLLSRKRRFKDGPNQGKVKAHKGDNHFSHSLYPISKKQVPTNSCNIEEAMPTEPNVNGDAKHHPKEPNGLKRAKSTKQKGSIYQSEDVSVRGKSSSRELVSEKENSSLKSNIVQSTPSKDLPKSNDLNAVEQHASETIGECSKPLGIREKEYFPSHVTDGSIQATSGTPKDSAGPRSIDSSEFKDHYNRKPEGQRWMQKSSWRELVGGVGSSSFSISNVLPGIHNLPKSKSLDVANSTDNKVKLLETELTAGIISNDVYLGKNGNLHSKSSSHNVHNMETSAVAGQTLTGIWDSQLHETTERNSQNEKVDKFSNEELLASKDDELLHGETKAIAGKKRKFMLSESTESSFVNDTNLSQCIWFLQNQQKEALWNTKEAADFSIVHSSLNEINNNNPSWRD